MIASTLAIFEYYETCFRTVNIKDWMLPTVTSTGTWFTHLWSSLTFMLLNQCDPIKSRTINKYQCTFHNISVLSTFTHSFHSSKTTFIWLFFCLWSLTCFYLIFIELIFNHINWNNRLTWISYHVKTKWWDFFGKFFGHHL